MKLINPNRSSKTSGSSVIKTSYLWILLFLAISSLQGVAQSSTADVVGTITDPTGAFVPNAKVTVLSLSTRDARQGASDSNGEYAVSGLQPGTYSVSVEAEGFRKFVVAHIELSAGDRIRVDTPLVIGGISETIEVATVASALQTDSSSLSTVVGEKPVQDLPLNGRNFVQLAQLAIGTNEGPASSLASGARPDDRRQTSSISANGQSDTENNELVDGMDNNERMTGAIGVRPSIDAIAEFRVQTNLYTAEVGRTAGAIVNIITKSGGDSFHGTLYEYLRNDKLDGRDYFAKQGIVSKPELRQNQFGGSLSGPIKKAKMFFFGDAELLRIVQGQTYTLTVPTLYEEQHPGDFTDQVTASGAGPNVSANVNPIALEYFKLYPAPTSSGFSNNFTSNPKYTQFSSTYDGRVDYHIAAKDSAFARYTYNNISTNTPSALPEVNGILPEGNQGSYPGLASQYAMNALLSFTHVFSDHLLLELKTGYSRISNGQTSSNNGKNLDDQFGIVNGNVLGITGLTPQAPTGYAGLGDATFLPLLYFDNNFQYYGAVTYTRGKHSFKAGAALIRREATDYQLNSGLGTYVYTAEIGTTSTPISSYAMANFLTGHAYTVARSVALNRPGFRAWEPSVFVEDDWHPFAKLTLNLGLRYDVFTPYTEAHGYLSNFDFRSLTLQIPGQNGVNQSAGVGTDFSNLAPRIGFAYSACPRTVVRGGFGLTFFPDTTARAPDLRNAPYVFSYAPNPNTVGLSTPLPIPVPSSTVQANFSGSYSGIAPGFGSSYVEQFNINVQQEFVGNVITIGYVGELGRQLSYYPNLNLAPAVAGLAFAANRRPLFGQLPNVTGISILKNGTTSNYHGLQTQVERRLSHGLAVTANYTWSHELGSSQDYSVIQSEGLDANPYNYSKLEFGNGDLDLRHRFAIQANYELGLGAGASGLRAIAEKNWQFNIIDIWETGSPFTVVNGQALSGSGISTDRPNLVGNPFINIPHGDFFNPAAFAAQPLGTYGTERRNAFYGPHFRHADLSLVKRFNLPDRTDLEFRAEAFNVSNTPNFANPNSTLGSAVDGTISSTRAGSTPRQIQFALKLEF